MAFVDHAHALFAEEIDVLFCGLVGSTPQGSLFASLSPPGGLHPNRDASGLAVPQELLRWVPQGFGGSPITPGIPLSVKELHPGFT